MDSLCSLPPIWSFLKVCLEEIDLLDQCCLKFLYSHNFKFFNKMKIYCREVTVWINFIEACSDQQHMSRTLWNECWCSTAVVPSLFGTRDGLGDYSFSVDWQGCRVVGERGGFSVVQAHHIYCVLYDYYISSISDHQALDGRSWGPLHTEFLSQARSMWDTI